LNLTSFTTISEQFRTIDFVAVFVYTKNIIYKHISICHEQINMIVTDQLAFGTLSSSFYHVLSIVVLHGGAQPNP